MIEEITRQVNISEMDIEICIIESPASNLGFRGGTGDEALINYKIEI